MTPAIMTHAETRAWLRSLGLTGVRLPKAGTLVYIAVPNGRDVWTVRLHASGGYLVAPYVGKL